MFEAESERLSLPAADSAGESRRLVDRFGRLHNYLRISVTDRCNLRCFYCMPPEGIHTKLKSEILSYEEVYRVARIFVGLGVEKIRLTGGEPLVRRDICKLVESVASIPGLRNLSMTSNGVRLAEMAQDLKNSGLQSINISLDSLRADRFAEITLRDNHAQVIRGIEAAEAAGLRPLKLNVVVVKGRNEDEILDFVRFVKDREINVRFIEYMPFKDNRWCSDAVYSYKEMKAVIEQEFQLLPSAGKLSDVARDFELPGGLGSVSFISSMTESFCSSCNRLRLTADGSIKSCLFYNPEVSLRERLRDGVSSDLDIEQLITYALENKPEAHPPMEELLISENRAMVEIGG